ncbi:unnamed protein product [Ilex paraguariensis]|uniref:RNase H type-1 domain-containing protein n=1 Tax=Ilex paraguariensis TaxID=185542 RepID=A0ABC8SNN1_9AQUA
MIIKQSLHCPKNDPIAASTISSYGKWSGEKSGSSMNRACLEEEVFSPDQIASFSITFLSHFTATQSDSSIFGFQDFAVSSNVLFPPTTSVLIINFDDSVFNEQAGGLGIVVSDYEGSFITGFSQVMRGLSSVFHVEAIAAFKAMKLAIDMGYTYIMLEGDSKEIIEVLKEKKPSLADIGIYT